MYSSIVNDTFHYLATMDSFRKEFQDVSWVKITTITMISNMDVEIDVQKIKKIFNFLGEVVLARKGSCGEGFKWSVKETSFYNQVTLNYTDAYSTKSIKLFPNGAIQVAGCTDLMDCNRVIRQLTVLVKVLLDKVIPIKSFQVVMINSNFSINHNLNLMEVAHHFGKNPIFDVSFDPDRYSAVKIKFKPAEDMKKVTVSIFGTGKVIITGAETLKEIVFAYNIINQHVNSNQNIRVEKTETVDVFDEFQGYPISQLVPFIKDKGYAPWRMTKENYKINFY